jgi:phosphoribosylformimino-5-aminoimidazole carboxamide ribonucleotide (ProFAR) isomerase
MDKYVNHEVLVNLFGRKELIETAIEKISPNKLFVKLDGPRSSHRSIGWLNVDDVEVVDDLGSLQSLYGYGIAAS